MWGFNCSICKEPEKLCDCPICAQCKAYVSEYFLEDGICEQCRDENYTQKHQCESCGDIYPGNLIYVGDNCCGYACNYCPTCAANEIAYELSRYDQAVDIKDKNAHAHEALKMIERLQKNLIELLSSD